MKIETKLLPNINKTGIDIDIKSGLDKNGELFLEYFVHSWDSDELRPVGNHRK
jgi:hypothetical protein